MTKLTPDTHKAIVDLVRQGNYPQVAANANSISDTTFAQWMEEAARGVEPYKQFKADIDQAEQESIDTSLEAIKTHARKGDKAAQKWLSDRGIFLD